MAYQDNCVQNSGGGVSRRTLVAAMAAGAGAIALGARDAGRRKLDPSRRRARSPVRRAISVPTERRPPISPTPTSSPSIRASMACANPTRRSSDCGPGLCGRRGRPGTAQGRYLVWSDIPNNRQMRWLEDDGHMSVFRMPYEQQQRQHVRLPGPADHLRASHAARTSVTNSTAPSTVIADNYNGKRLNSPNDIVPHPDGSIWFTDPPYGSQLYEGDGRRAGRPG